MAINVREEEYCFHRFAKNEKPSFEAFMWIHILHLLSLLCYGIRATIRLTRQLCSSPVLMEALNKSSDSSSIPPLSTPHSSILNSASHFITLKLTIDNYPLWKAQIVPFVKGQQLFGFVDDTVPPPSSNPDGSINTECTCWLLQDQLIISTINSSLTDVVLA